MKIDINSVKRSGKTREEFSFAYDAPQSLINLPNTTFDGQTEVLATLILGGGSVLVNAEVTFRLVGECSRCLNPAKKVITFEVEEEYTKTGENDTYKYNNDIIDLTKMVEDNILMNMPMTILCSEDCKGISYKCD